MSKLSDDRKRQLREKHHDNPIESKRRARVTYLRRRWSQHWADPNGVSAPEYHGADYAGRSETDVALGISRAEFVQIGTQTREPIRRLPEARLAQRCQSCGEMIESYTSTANVQLTWGWCHSGGRFEPVRADMGRDHAWAMK